MEKETDKMDILSEFINENLVEVHDDEGCMDKNVWVELDDVYNHYMTWHKTRYASRTPFTRNEMKMDLNQRSRWGNGDKTLEQWHGIAFLQPIKKSEALARMQLVREQQRIIKQQELDKLCDVVYDDCLTDLEKWIHVSPNRNNFPLDLNMHQSHEHYMAVKKWIKNKLVADGFIVNPPDGKYTFDIIVPE